VKDKSVFLDGIVSNHDDSSSLPHMCFLEGVEGTLAARRYQQCKGGCQEDHTAVG
jgi:hypothetical protein